MVSPITDPPVARDLLWLFIMSQGIALTVITACRLRKVLPFSSNLLKWRHSENTPKHFNASNIDH